MADLTAVGRMTATVIDVLLAFLARADHPEHAADVPPGAAGLAAAPA